MEEEKKGDFKKKATTVHFVLQMLSLADHGHWQLVEDCGFQL